MMDQLKAVNEIQQKQIIDNISKAFEQLGSKLEEKFETHLVIEKKRVERIGSFQPELSEDMEMNPQTKVSTARSKAGGMQ